MKENLTELVCILDKSGSMASLTDDTIGGFNSLIKKQKDEEGECLVTTVLFNSNIEILQESLKNLCDSKYGIEGRCKGYYNKRLSSYGVYCFVRCNRYFYRQN